MASTGKVVSIVALFLGWACAVVMLFVDIGLSADRGAKTVAIEDLTRQLISARAQLDTEASRAAQLEQTLATQVQASRSKTRSIVNGIISVAAASYQSYVVKVTPDMENPNLDGSFQASGGSGNDIAVLVMDEVNYINWINRHSANFLYESGQTTTGSVSVNHLDPGTYYLVFSNTFSALSVKSVATKVDLKYES